MGKHFDGLVEIVRDHINSDERDSEGEKIKEELVELIHRVKLIELPIYSKNLVRLLGKNRTELYKHLSSYLDISQRLGTHIATPFPVTGIEDNDSVVILNMIEGNYFQVLTCKSHEFLSQGKRVNNTVLNYAVSTVEVPKEEGGNELQAGFFYVAKVQSGSRLVPGSDNFTEHNLGHQKKAIKEGIITYIGEILYVMDKDTYIIKKENNQSISISKKRGKAILRRTELRPHYILLRHDEVGPFFGDNSQDERTRPIREHPMTFSHHRYVKMQGKTIFIPQNYGGNGEISKPGGWNFEVMLKIFPGRTVSYMHRHKYNRTAKN